MIMKKTKIMVLALAALTFGACTSDDVLITDEPTTSVLPGGEGYVSFNIKLPTTTSTRDATNPNNNFDNGVAAEYTVNDATLLLFKGESESAATFYAAYTLTNSFANTAGTNGDNITQSATFTQKITTPESGNIYALVVLNKTGMLNVAGSGEDATGYFGDNTNSLVGMTLSKIQETACSPNVSLLANASESSFYMTNAPLSNKAGGASDPTTGSTTDDPLPTISTLVQINSNKIHQSEETAKTDVAATINVERGVAKVTASTASGITDGKYTLSDGSTTVTVQGFILDLTNTATYPVRNSQTSDAWWGYKNTSVSSDYDPYRFVGSSAVTSLYRTYWATDPNYDNETTYKLNEVDDDLSETSFSTIDGATALYCLENTFSIDNQKKAATTRAIIKAQVDGYSGKNDEPDGFYSINDNGNIMTQTQVETEIKDELSTISAVNAAIKDYKGEGQLLDYITISGLDATSSSDDLEIKISLSESVTSTDFNTSSIYDALSSAISSEESTGVNSTINDLMKISYYKEGICYYAVPIQHFGDDLTPWDAETIFNDASNTTKASYPGDDAAQNWLGRYGVLRNNWYDLEISGITNIGSPNRPPVPDEYDDPINTWVGVTVNVLSWTYRTQSVTL